MCYQCWYRDVEVCDVPELGGSELRKTNSTRLGQIRFHCLHQFVPHHESMIQMVWVACGAQNLLQNLHRNLIFCWWEWLWSRIHELSQGNSPQVLLGGRWEGAVRIRTGNLGCPFSCRVLQKRTHDILLDPYPQIHDFTYKFTAKGIS